MTTDKTMIAVTAKHPPNPPSNVVMIDCEISSFGFSCLSTYATAVALSPEDVVVLFFAEAIDATQIGITPIVWHITSR